MNDVEIRMNEIKHNRNASTIEIYRLVRYLINVQEYNNSRIFDELVYFDEDKINQAIKKVETENSKPKPKRYYVSLKEPLEDNY